MRDAPEPVDLDDADLLDHAARIRPGHKVILVQDPEGTGYDFIITVPPKSPWHELLADRQVVRLRRGAATSFRGAA